ncbi:DNA (cytosine-5)-methyltransferase DRM2-like [Arachis ipaensis]|uniref:DNA (cytosine-5)-methyltransferase DRM2-like n=1 Tax=Arachis ipaensis TaxID=130454 RepID=UPI000A2B111F|nr:DNA (cytosine-5)-methyltransferase DRM2-like [Arachis ipaensis]QHO11506.1 uncharacterized protein DS421_15g498710 [Arachis hypogaea]
MHSQGSSSRNQYDWDSDDDLEVFGMPQESNVHSVEESGSTCSSAKNSKLIHHFLGMGFSVEEVIKAIEEDGEDNEENILETLLTLAATIDDPMREAFREPCDFAKKSVTTIDISDDNDDYDISDSEIEEDAFTSEKDETLSILVNMGYPFKEALIAIDKCGPGADLSDLADFICAAQLEKEIESHLQDRPNRIHDTSLHVHKRSRDHYYNGKKKSRMCRTSQKKPLEIDMEEIELSIPTNGFSIAKGLYPRVVRKIPDKLAGPPYFYYENVAIAPVGVWNKISNFLYGIQPEFVDSKLFCASTRKRGYIHNLPTENRFPLLPIQPLTVQEALPTTRKWWPKWDRRTQLNCLLTSIGAATVTEKIRRDLEECGAETPPPNVQDTVLKLCKKWNLVWVGKNKVATLEPDEYEMLLGFPKDHTRGGGISRTDRYKALGNAFQVDTVAYHLSVLKDQYPNGVNVLSLFSGIGGAEVALHRLGIKLKNVVSAEISEVNRNILRCWWEQTEQRGNLFEVEDVQRVTSEHISHWINRFGGFDLVIGGSPCNNLSGSNRVSRDGLDGEHSSLFYEYYRIVNEVMQAQR